MLTKLPTTETFVSTNFMLVDNLIVEEKKIPLHALSKQNEKIFYRKGMSYYQLVFSKHQTNFDLLPCKVIKNGSTVESIVQYLQEYSCLVVLKGNSNEMIGYIHVTAFIPQLLTNFRELQAYISTILDTVDESCTVINQSKRVIAWTKGAEQLFSVNKEKIIGQSITDFFSRERLEILNTLEKGTSVYHHQHQARENQVVLINSNPVRLNDTIIGAVVSETDITSQIRLNKELYQARERLFHLEKEVTKLTAKEDPFQAIRGNSPVLNRTIHKIKKAAATDTGILIYGESGVGKELFAKAVHHIREAEEAPFVAINCGAIPSSLFESEIFGYEKGAFSGADLKGKKGKAELAQGGTLFLDEVGEMPLEMQVKTLRLLQEKAFYRVGGTKEIHVDFRVIAATNKDLKALVTEGKFREDLYYRLNIISIEIPPLRQRPEDIIELTHYFLHEISIKYQQPIHGISQEVMQALLQHSWPGNIRELQNVIERLVVFAEDGEIHLEELPFDVDQSHTPSNFPPESAANDNLALSTRLEEVERKIILQELKKAGGNKLLCAKNLHITRATLYNRLKKLGIQG
ncbi:sigma 54-interacting transcriptional regulator [Virgibacillus pantothenticus]|nr:sigma 54-interacting transcriptional regulator [Virgibacillus pantothenticus]MED3737557.1 sigma 54-interacting transcriptional regulator [Virgibacillus pantothenticus]SIS93571.1 PAS domain S-box-containing protein [Virgibacillus pantothenticus]